MHLRVVIASGIYSLVIASGIYSPHTLRGIERATLLYCYLGLFIFRPLPDMIMCAHISIRKWSSLMKISSFFHFTMEGT